MRLLQVVPFSLLVSARGSMICGDYFDGGDGFCDEFENHRVGVHFPALWPVRIGENYNINGVRFFGRGY